jgi:hypothetical protein
VCGIANAEGHWPRLAENMKLPQPVVKQSLLQAQSPACSVESYRKAYILNSNLVRNRYGAFAKAGPNLMLAICDLW